MVVKVELITKKVPKRVIPKLRKLQAVYMLKHQKKISEAEIIEQAIEKLGAEELKEKKVKHSLEKIFGIGKSGAKGDASKDVDEVVYGV